jgi:hypothetical protein
MIHQLTDKPKEIWAIEVPEGAPVSEAYIGEDCYDDETVHYLTFGNLDEIPLPPGSWRYICTSKDIKWKDACKIVERFTYGFRNYHIDSDLIVFQSPFKSLSSLLASKGLDNSKQNLVYLENIKK